MKASVLIPTRGRAERLCGCLRLLARQSLDAAEYEVVVGFDGPDEAALAQAQAAWGEAGGRSGGLRVIEYPRQGLIGVRNGMIGEARGRLLVSINDDVLPGPTFLAAHVAAHKLRAADAPAIVVGHSPYVMPQPGSGQDSLLNRLARETSLVFFYDVMNTPEGLKDRERDWGFRHCFGLNFSTPLEAVRAVGGFTRVECPYGYEDIELAYKLRERFGTPVLYRPKAFAPHEHFYVARDIIERERMLGRTAWHFARANAGFGRAVFGCDIRSRDEVAYGREFVRRERAGAERLRASFELLDAIPASAVEGANAGELLTLIQQQFLLLKRWTWRAGLMEAADQEEAARPVREAAVVGGR